MRGCIVKVDASVFNGFNVGRFPNQGGLFAGLKCLAEESRPNPSSTCSAGVKLFGNVGVV